MSSSELSPSDSSSRTQAQPDHVRQRFHAAWQRGTRPSLAMLLSDLAEPARLELLQELLPIDIEKRRAQGEAVHSSDYTSELPAHQQIIREIVRTRTGEPSTEETLFTGSAERTTDYNLPTVPEDEDALAQLRKSWLALPRDPHDASFELRTFARRLVNCGIMTELDLAGFRAAFSKQQMPVTVQELSESLEKSGILTEYQVAVLRGWTTEPLVLGNYLIEDTLGAGGMGQVYQAHHRTMDRRVALKVLSPDLTTEPSAIERFQREVRAAAHLDHPNIVTAFDAAEENGTHYLVMQHINGRNLHETVVDDGPMSVDVAVDCILQAARGLEYAHQRGVIHRDIKPSNLLRSESGAISILDMGLALTKSSATESRNLTRTGIAIGTVDYMAPEQARNSHAADERSDLYALGCTLFFLLTGRPVYTGETHTARLVAHQEEPVPNLNELCPAAPPALVHTFERLVAKNSSDRFQSATEVIQCLESLPAPGRTPDENGVEPTRSETNQPSTSRVSVGVTLLVLTVIVLAVSALLLPLFSE